MSVIIKGMDMPEQLHDIADSNAITIYNCQIFIDSKGNASIRIRGHKEEYPIVKIPTPHGRLIDADELLRRPTNILFNKYPKSCVRNAPTVIEAEVSE